MVKLYFGIGKVPEGAKRGTAEQALRHGKVLYWGLNKVDKNMINEQKEKDELDEKKAKLRNEFIKLKGKYKSLKETYEFSKDPEKKEDAKLKMIKTHDRLKLIKNKMDDLEGREPTYEIKQQIKKEIKKQEKEPEEVKEEPDKNVIEKYHITQEQLNQIIKFMDDVSEWAKIMNKWEDEGKKGPEPVEPRVPKHLRRAYNEYLDDNYILDNDIDKDMTKEIIKQEVAKAIEEQKEEKPKKKVIKKVVKKESSKSESEKSESDKEPIKKKVIKKSKPESEPKPSKSETLKKAREVKAAKAKAKKEEETKEKPVFKTVAERMAYVRAQKKK